MQTINNSNTNRRGIKPSLETSNLTFGPRVRHSSLLAIATLGLTLMFNLATAHADPSVFEASGATPADIQAAVDGFRNFGDFGTNNGVGGTFPHGRREINWDGVPDARSAPNLLPANFFNSNSPRGVVFFTPGTGFQVSANLVSSNSKLRSDLETSTVSIPRCLARSVPKGSSPPWIAPSRKICSSYLELHKRQRSKDWRCVHGRECPRQHEDRIL